METPLTRNIDAAGEPPDVRAYEARGGYEAVRKALEAHEPADVTQMVKDADLRGRGGAGFPTGMKWGFMPVGDEAPAHKFLIANADEMEPGTFKDRLLLEGDPHQLLEAMIISGYAVQADVGYIFLRGEYRLAAARLRRAIGEAEARGWLGGNILDTDYGLQLRLHTSAGRYMCGEETALLSALQGQRALPRAKPPYPQLVGLWGRPTVVNNVETLCNVPHIVNRGPEWFKALSRSGAGGTKIFGASGKVRRPGAWELPMGTTIRELIEAHAGGMCEGHGFRGVLPGGASTDFLVESHLDAPMDFDAIEKLGSRMGTGALIVLDDRTCPVAMVRNLEHFFAQESCGWCTPCRDGLPYVEQILDAIERGEGRREDLDVLEMHTSFLGPGNTFCAHAPGAMEPLQSALKYFGDDFERHIDERKCPYA